MHILPSQKSTAGFNILDSFQNGFSSSKGGDLFADLLKYSTTTSASLPALAPTYADPLLIAPSSSTVTASSARLEEPDMPASHADDSLRNVKMSREDYAGVRDKLEQAGVSKEKLEELDKKVQSPEGMTWGQLMHSVREATLEKISRPAQLTEDDKAAISSLLTRIGFEPKQAEELTAGLASGQPAKAFAAISAKLKELSPDQTLSLSKDEMGALAKALKLSDSHNGDVGAFALAKALKLSDSASQRLMAKFGSAEKVQLTPEGMRQTFVAVKQELSGQLAQAKDALQTVRDALHPAMEKARQQLEIARQATDGQVESSQVKPSSLLKDPQDHAQVGKDAQHTEGKSTGSNATQVDPALAARDARQQNQRFTGQDGSGSQNGSQQGKTAHDKAVGEFTGKLRVEGEGQTFGDSRFGIGQALNASSAAQAKGDASQVLKGQNTQVLNQVESGILRNMGQGVKQLTLELTPDNLGKLNIILTVKGKDVQAVIRADSPEAEKVLAENLQQIKQSLENQGLTVSKMEVRPGISQDSNLGQQWAGAEKHNQSQDRRDALERLRASSLLTDVAGGTGLAQGMQNTGAEVKISQGGLDIMA
ncbi:MAG: flagellar hook-length control protein [Desulfovibrionaceae bacterium]|nr:MAG: flagellar hook-length control protein [Desulfovibrionaceae bacterium]